MFAEQYAGETLPYELMGKPTSITYDWCTQVLGPDLDHYYGVGDNQESDIKGANSAGPKWKSILVKTGLWRGHEPLKVPPSFIYSDVLEAVQEISKMEGSRN